MVLVHGLLGWGSYDELNKITAGIGTGGGTDYLKLYGYKCYAASVGPASSAWDRACRAVRSAHGTQVDYGILHAKNMPTTSTASATPAQMLIPGYTVKQHE